MVVFWEPAVRPLLEAVRPKTIVEIGARTGSTTVKLLELASQIDTVVHSIDPNPDATLDVAELRARHGDRFVFHQEMSLDALPKIEHIDAVLIDGDHNWYTVHSELELLARASDEEGRTFPLVALHDVDWPYGRRDNYPNLEAIPPEYRQPHERGGAIPGTVALSTSTGMRVDTHKAVEEGTPRNGVRTAVEDFLAETDLALRFKSLPGFAGLGIIAPESEVDSNPELRRVLEGFDSPEWLSNHCRRIEQARLRAVARLAGLRGQAPAE
jgi:methyltransferase family protein